MPEPEFDVFLSHASPDKPVVEEIARILDRRGIRPWLDKWHLQAGELWMPEIEKALESCAACAVCIGPNGFGNWQTEEMNAAIQLQVSSRRGRVIPVLLPGAEQKERDALPLFLRGRTWVDFHATLEDEEALQRLIRSIRGEKRPAPNSGEALVEGMEAPRRLPPTAALNTSTWGTRPSSTAGKT